MVVPLFVLCFGLAAEPGPPPHEARPYVVAELGVEPPAGHSLPTPSIFRWSTDGKRLLAVYPGDRTWRSLEEQGNKFGGSQRGRPRNPAPSVLAVWDVARGEVVWRRECPGRVIDATLDRTGTAVRAAGDDDTFRTWSLGPPATETEATLDPKPKFSHYRVVELLPDGRLVTWLPPGTSLVAEVYDATGTRVATQTVAGLHPPFRGRMVGERPVIPLRPEPGVVVFPDGRRTDVVSGRRLPPLEMRKWHAPTDRRGCTANSALIACPVEFSGIHFWDTLTGGYVGRLSGADQEWAVVALSPDGRWLVGGNQDVVVLHSVRLGIDPVRLPIKWAHALAFSPDGTRLAVAQSGEGVRVWRLPTATPTNEPVRTPDDLWMALARPDAQAAWEALSHLLDYPAEATALLASRLKLADKRDTAEQIARLDHDRYTVREMASRELAGRGAAAEDDLRLALRKPKSEEQRKRLEALLGKLDPAIPPEGEQLRALRAVWLLDRIGSGDAKKVLENLAGGASGSRVTAEAKAALGHLR